MDDDDPNDRGLGQPGTRVQSQADGQLDPDVVPGYRLDIGGTPAVVTAVQTDDDGIEDVIVATYALTEPGVVQADEELVGAFWGPSTLLKGRGGLVRVGLGFLRGAQVGGGVIDSAVAVSVAGQAAKAAGAVRKRSAVAAGFVSADGSDILSGLSKTAGGAGTTNKSRAAACGRCFQISWR